MDSTKYQQLELPQARIMSSPCQGGGRYAELSWAGRRWGTTLAFFGNVCTANISIRRTIYLTIQSSLDFEEAVHKLLKLNLQPGIILLCTERFDSELGFYQGCESAIRMTLVRIWIQLFILIRIRIQLFTLIRIQLFTLIRILIQLLTLMWIRFRILLLIIVVRICDHWPTNLKGLHIEPPPLHFERPRPSKAPFWASKASEFWH
jgi:hypothetical protein